MPEELLPFPVAEYRDMQRSIPGVDGLYMATRAILDAALPEDGTLLVVGAGGGRELELFHDLRSRLRLLAVDISTQRLAQAKSLMDTHHRGSLIDYVAGEVDAAPTETWRRSVARCRSFFGMRRLRV